MKLINILVSSLTLLTSHAYGDAVIFSGNDVKTLKPNIDLYGQGKILSGSTDPTSVATSAPVGSIYLNTSNGNLYRKVDAGSSTNWQKVGSAAVAGNLLPNPDWETGTTGWTASAGSYARTTTAADVGFGAGSGSFDASAASQTLTSTAVAIPTGLYASNGLASCYIKTAASDYIMQVYDGTNVIGSATIAASTQYTRTNVNFVFPSSGNISLRISSQSNAAIMYMDDCYVGPATNISQVSQATFIGSAYIAATASCLWTISATGSLHAFNTTAACPGPTIESNPGPGTLGTTDSDLPKFPVSNLAPGTYRVAIQFIGTGNVSTVAGFGIYDGTSVSQASRSALGFGTTGVGSYQVTLEGVFTYATASSPTFEIYGDINTGTNVNTIDNQAGGGQPRQVSIKIYRLPSSSELAVRSDQTVTNVSSSATATTNWPITSGQFGDLTSISLSPGTWDISAYTTIFNNGSVTAQPMRFGIGTISGNNSPDVIEMSNYNAGTTSLRYPMIVTPTTVTVAATTTYYLKGRMDTSAANVQNLGYGINARKIGTSTPAPILVGSVTSNSAGAERVERLYVAASCTSSPCTIASQSGSWVSSVSRSAVGTYQVNLSAGMFASPPSCSAQSVDNNRVIYLYSPPTTSNVFVAGTVGTTSALADVGFHLICQGPR